MANPLLNVDVIIDGYCAYDAWTETDDLPSTAFDAALSLSDPALVCDANTRREAAGLPPLHTVPLPPTASTPRGHKILLTLSAWLSASSMFCGVISPDMLKNKKGVAMLESIDIRIANVKKFMQRLTKRRELTVDVAQINDPYGPPQDTPKYSAIVGSLETLAGCEAVNDIRHKNGLEPLDIYVIDVISKNARVAQHEMETKISSTYIRNYLASHQPIA
ncbi:hypothetical protein SeLEV6574_g05821 [Synchytrium endobioticum]|nr:hypothetical protein SeLEV6574_g05821 [Synchytrium endobioticum]